MAMQIMSIVEDSSETGRLHLSGDALCIASRIRASVIDITPAFAPERERVEQFIRTSYANHYGADIAVAYPTLMSVRTESGDILGAIGFRYAAEEPLFLERYTGQPIEQCLSECYPTPVIRSEIAEIGNLASTGQGASLYLFAALSAYLHAKHIRYATITGTHSLHRRFCKLGLQAKSMCPADPAQLTDAERARWGSYYEERPQVLAGAVAEGAEHLRHALGLIYEDLPQPLFPRLHYQLPGIA